MEKPCHVVGDGELKSLGRQLEACDSRHWPDGMLFDCGCPDTVGVMKVVVAGGWAVRTVLSPILKRNVSKGRLRSIKSKWKGIYVLCDALDVVSTSIDQERMEKAYTYFMMPWMLSRVY